MAGNEDRGGVAELIALTKKSRTPVICMCNDRQSPKIRSLANHCFDLRFQRPRADQIRAAMMSVCFKEKVKIAPDALTELIVGCNQDVRQVLHHLSLLKGRGDTEEKMTAEQAKSEAESSKKTSIKVVSLHLANSQKYLDLKFVLLFFAGPLRCRPQGLHRYRAEGEEPERQGRPLLPGLQSRAALQPGNVFECGTSGGEVSRVNFPPSRQFPTIPFPLLGATRMR